MRPSLSTIMKTSRVPSTSVRKCRSLRSRSPARVALVRDIISWRTSTTRIVRALTALTKVSTGRALPSSTMTVTAASTVAKSIDLDADSDHFRVTRAGIVQRADHNSDDETHPAHRADWSVRMPALCPTSPNVATTSAIRPGGSRPVRPWPGERGEGGDRDADRSSIRPSWRAAAKRASSRSCRRRRLDAERPGEHEGAAEHDQHVDRQLDKAPRSCPA